MDRAVAHPLLAMLTQAVAKEEAHGGDLGGSVSDGSVEVAATPVVVVEGTLYAGSVEVGGASDGGVGRALTLLGCAEGVDVDAQALAAQCALHIEVDTVSDLVFPKALGCLGGGGFSGGGLQRRRRI